MSASAQQQAPVAPAPDPAGRVAAPDPASVVARVRRGTSTPDRLRRWSVVSAAVCVLAAFVATIAVGAYGASTDSIRDNSGPVVVQTQTLLASLAEADAAATAAFLSGRDEDPTARRTHLDARERAAAQLEDVSALIGDDTAAHDALKEFTADLTRYVGQVEAARATRLAGLDEIGQQYLGAAVTTLSTDLTQGGQELIQLSEARLDEDASSLGTQSIVATVVLLAALALLLWYQVRLYRTTRRILNLPLAGATLAVLVAAVWSAASMTASQAAFDEARDEAFVAITTVSEIQTAAFALNDAETIAVITGTEADVTGILEEVTRVERLRDIADTEREASRALEAVTWWGRYLERRETLRGALAPVLPDGAADARLVEVEAAYRDMSAAFNGFAFTVEGILADNTDQFTAGLEAATDRTAGLLFAALILPLAAAALALWGFQLRINEYR